MPQGQIWLKVFCLVGENYILGFLGKGCRRGVLRMQFDCVRPSTSKRNDDPLLGIGEGNSEFGSTAGICGTDTLRGYWGGVRGSNFQHWLLKSYAPTFIQLPVKMMKKLARVRSRPIRDQFPLSVEDIAATDNATTEMEPFGAQLKPMPLRKSAPRKVGARTTAIQETQTPMPLSEIPNGIGPPPPDSLTATRGLGRRGRFTKEQKGKVKPSTSRRPRLWAPNGVTPNQTAGVLTRARRSLAQEYTQQRQNDVVIKDVIADLSEGMEDEVVDLTAPDSQHTPGSMDTLNVNLWDSVFRGDGWRT